MCLSSSALLACGKVFCTDFKERGGEGLPCSSLPYSLLKPAALWEKRDKQEMKLNLASTFEPVASRYLPQPTHEFDVDANDIANFKFQKLRRDGRSPARVANGVTFSLAAAEEKFRLEAEAVGAHASRNSAPSSSSSSSASTSTSSSTSCPSPSSSSIATPATAMDAPSATPISSAPQPTKLAASGSLAPSRREHFTSLPSSAMASDAKDVLQRLPAQPQSPANKPAEKRPRPPPVAAKENESGIDMGNRRGEAEGTGTSALENRPAATKSTLAGLNSPAKRIKVKQMKIERDRRLMTIIKALKAAPQEQADDVFADVESILDKAGLLSTEEDGTGCSGGEGAGTENNRISD